MVAFLFNMNRSVRLIKAGLVEQGRGFRSEWRLISKIAPPLFVSQKYFAGPFLEP